MDRPHIITPGPATPADPQPADLGEHATRLHLPLHVHARGLALGIIATVAFLYALQWGRNFLVPLLLGIFIAYTLNPLVNWLERIRVKRVIGATIVTAAIFGGAVVVVDKVHGEFQNIVEELPTITHKLSRLLASTTGSSTSTISRIQAVATEIEQATAGNSARRAIKRQQDVTAPGAGGIRVMDWVWVSARSLIGFASQGTMVIFLVFFLLLSGDTFKRKLVKLTGPSLTKKKITVHILEDINTSIQAYMFMLLVTNVLLAFLMWIALRAIGLENAGAWAIVAGLLHIMPYFGPLLITSATGLVAFLQFESLQMVLLVTGASLGIATLVGTFVTTWMTGRIARMNAAAVFVSLLFWGWLWGVWGLLLGVPVIVILKVVAERVEGMEVVAELLGE
ncbi:putative PurR-regulated permease PerM [Pseudoduganella flava]|uniref:AI-2E family transporter n=1 Tax=Pseudoduganella flava TaxID=871742 RepID=A0A562PJ03_9BURK|nr:AI-2E family transporter [Pseudoduganella flava]TWI44442.1 putative PurR-regulated permease PerM [Pseudoduganella flava]